MIQRRRLVRQSAQGWHTEGALLYAFTLAKGEGLEQDFCVRLTIWLLKSGESAVDDLSADRAGAGVSGWKANVDPRFWRRRQDR